MFYGFYLIRKYLLVIYRTICMMLSVVIIDNQQEGSNKMKLQGRYVTDDRHGWIVISEDQIRLIGLSADDFSAFSYFRVLNGKTYFALEEDADAFRLIRRIKAKSFQFDFPETHEGFSSLIRTWSSIELLHSHKDQVYSQQPLMAAQ